MHIENAAYLLKFDSVYGRYNNTVEVEGDDALYL
jgi:glyceraldehyde-3-phosphate dehydrogenase/erythrose-4-phosphate dehydrogenase